MRPGHFGERVCRSVEVPNSGFNGDPVIAERPEDLVVFGLVTITEAKSARGDLAACNSCAVIWNYPSRRCFDVDRRTKDIRADGANLNRRRRRRELATRSEAASRVERCDGDRLPLTSDDYWAHIGIRSSEPRMFVP